MEHPRSGKTPENLLSDHPCKAIAADALPFVTRPYEKAVLQLLATVFDSHIKSQKSICGGLSAIAERLNYIGDYLPSDGLSKADLKGAIVDAFTEVTLDTDLLDLLRELNTSKVEPKGDECTRTN